MSFKLVVLKNTDALDVWRTVARKKRGLLTLYEDFRLLF
jgi:sporulation-control protein spo0M